jgi:hypothetical protein
MMTTQTTRENSHVNYHQKIHDLIAQAEKYAMLCDSPKRVEFKLCAFLAGWEATVRHDSKAWHWFALWQGFCRKRHRGKTGRTLGDPVKAPSLSERWHVPQEEEAKAYKSVRDGLRRVFEVTLSHCCPTGRENLCLMTGTDEPAILFQKIRDSLESGKSFATPEGFEVFLLTLIELFEQSVGANDSSRYAHEAWLSEIHRRRLGGSPETRTLADVAPAQVRLERQNAFSEKERTKILRTILSAMRQLAEKLGSYLEKCTS